MTRIRYTAQRFGTNEWLSFDLPITTDGPWDTFNTYESLEGFIAPEVGSAIAEDGRPVIEKWGTWIHAESEDERLWTGIVDEIYVEDASLHIFVRDWHGYPDGITYTDKVWGVEDDPADLMRDIWAHLQSFPNSGMGVTVTGSTNIKLGTKHEDAVIATKQVMDAKKVPYDAQNKKVTAKEAEVKKKAAPFDKELKPLERDRKLLTRTYDRAVKDKKPKPVIDAAKAAVDAKSAQITTKRDARENALFNLNEQLEILRDALEPLRDAYDEAREKYDEARKKMDELGGAWKVLPEDLPDTWSIIKDLVDEGGFEFHPRTVRTAGAPKLFLDIRQPRVGGVRDDLVFEQGRNISEIPRVERPDIYASELIAVGAGEGSGDDKKSLRVTLTEDDPRLRRNIVFSDPAITKLGALRTRGRKELARYRADVTVPEIKVFDTPNCPIGAWSAGDIIHVKLHNVPHFGRVLVKHRISSWQRVGTSEAILRLEPYIG